MNIKCDLLLGQLLKDFIITISNFIDIEKLDSIFETRCLLQRGRSVETDIIKRV